MLNFLYKKALKLITKGKVSKGGRNFLGRVCVSGRSFLKRRLFINVNFIRRLNILGFLCKYIYDVNRTSKVGLLMFTNGLMSCVILSDKIRLGDVLYSGVLSANSKFKVCNGDAVPLKYMPLFSVLHNVELKPEKGAQIMRAGGSSCIFIGKVKDKAILKLNSGWEVKVSGDGMSTLGVAALYSNKYILKAGKCRALGFRPKVRGVAKNPCDHAHGGGNGKRSKPTVPVNARVTMFKWKHTNNTQKDRLKRRMFKQII